MGITSILQTRRGFGFFKPSFVVPLSLMIISAQTTAFDISGSSQYHHHYQ